SKRPGSVSCALGARPMPSSSTATAMNFNAPARRLVAPALVVSARYTREVRPLLVDASIIEAISVRLTRPNRERRKVGRERGVRRRGEEPLDLRVVLAAKPRARDVDEAPAWTKERPQRVDQPDRQLRRTLDVRRGPARLDIRMPANHAERVARRIEQDPVERRAVPPVGRHGRVAVDERRTQPEPAEGLACGLEPRRVALDRDELGEPGAF